MHVYSFSACIGLSGYILLTSGLEKKGKRGGGRGMVNKWGPIFIMCTHPVDVQLSKYSVALLG